MRKRVRSFKHWTKTRSILQDKRLPPKKLNVQHI